MTDGLSSNSERAQRILDSAIELIAHYGFDKTTMDDIARAAGVSKGALYLHFRSKDDLLETLILRESERASDQLMQSLLAHQESGSLVTVYVLGLQVIAQNPLLRALYVNDRRVLGDYLRKLTTSTVYRQGFDFGQAYVEQMQAAGLLRSDIDAGVITYILSAIRYGLLTLESAVSIPNPPTLDAIAPVVGEMLERVLVPQGGDQEAGKRAFQELLAFGRRVIEERRAARNK